MERRDAPGMWLMLLLFLGFVGLIVAATIKAVKINDAAHAAGVPGGAVRVMYEGGHPQMPTAVFLRVWSTPDAIRCFCERTRKVIDIPRAALIALNLQSDVQHVNAGGGRSIGGAVVGAAIAGPVGAIIGSRKSSKIQRIDESKTLLVISHGGMQFTLVFKGGQQTYNQLAGAMAPSQALPASGGQ